jgi:hypothetical protein
MEIRLTFEQEEVLSLIPTRSDSIMERWRLVGIIWQAMEGVVSKSLKKEYYLIFLIIKIL